MAFAYQNCLRKAVKNEAGFLYPASHILVSFCCVALFRFLIAMQHYRQPRSILCPPQLIP
jgi:hypothetical protein